MRPRATVESDWLQWDYLPREHQRALQAGFGNVLVTAEQDRLRQRAASSEAAGAGLRSEESGFGRHPRGVAPGAGGAVSAAAGVLGTWRSRVTTGRPPAPTTVAPQPTIHTPTEGSGVAGLELLGGMHPTHDLRSLGRYTFCKKCGAHAIHIRMSKALAELCGDRPANRFATARLDKLIQGVAPDGFRGIPTAYSADGHPKGINSSCIFMCLTCNRKGIHEGSSHSGILGMRT